MKTQSTRAKKINVYVATKIFDHGRKQIVSIHFSTPEITLIASQARTFGLANAKKNILLIYIYEMKWKNHVKILYSTFTQHLYIKIILQPTGHIGKC